AARNGATGLSSHGPPTVREGAHEAQPADVLAGSRSGPSNGEGASPKEDLGQSPVARAQNGSRFKDCPDCAEQVLAAARVCKHCGFRFRPPPSENRDDAQPAPAATGSMALIPRESPEQAELKSRLARLASLEQD